MKGGTSDRGRQIWAIVLVVAFVLSTRVSHGYFPTVEPLLVVCSAALVAAQIPGFIRSTMIMSRRMFWIGCTVAAIAGVLLNRLVWI